MRINKYLAMSGLASRRKCEQLVLDKKVSVNGKVVSNLAFDVSDDDNVRVEGKRVSIPNKFTYLMMHKPKGFLTTAFDDRNRKTVMELLPQNFKNLMPVGRLDYNSEGLLLFTNDGNIAQKLMKPANEVPKVYLVKVEGDVSADDVKKIENGVTLVDGTKFKECSVQILENKDRKTKLQVTLKEGKNREIRKIFGEIGFNVYFLKRLQIGEIKLGGLSRGKTRLLHQREIEYLKSL